MPASQLLALSLSAYMTGVIWIIQLVHYPAFLDVESLRFQKFHNQHTRAMGYIVGPAMIGEMILAIYLIQSFKPIWIFNFLIVLALWLITFLESVPCHNKLSLIKSDVLIARLIKGNWVRTVLWSVKSVGLLTYVAW